METEINLPFILGAAIISTASPGPATLAIAGTSMARGRSYGLALACGVLSGSLIWSIAAALGLATLMTTSGWIFTTLRYAGACYLIYLAFQSARSALRPGMAKTRAVRSATLSAAYKKGLALHLTNPKAILFFGALYSLGVPADAGFSALALVLAAVGVQSTVIFLGYALLFSSPPMVAAYTRLRRWLEAAFAAAFGLAGFKMLTTRIETG